MLGQCLQQSVIHACMGVATSKPFTLHVKHRINHVWSWMILPTLVTEAVPNRSGQQRANREASTARACPRSRRHPIRNSSASTEPPARSLARTDETTEGKEAQLHSAVRQMWTRLGITKNQQSQNRPEPSSKSRSLKKLHASHTSRPVVEAFE